MHCELIVCCNSSALFSNLMITDSSDLACLLQQFNTSKLFSRLLVLDSAELMQIKWCNETCQLQGVSKKIGANFETLQQVESTATAQMLGSGHSHATGGLKCTGWQLTRTTDLDLRFRQYHRLKLFDKVLCRWGHGTLACWVLNSTRSIYRSDKWQQPTSKSFTSYHSYQVVFLNELQKNILPIYTIHHTHVQTMFHTSNCSSERECKGIMHVLTLSKSPKRC